MQCFNGVLIGHPIFWEIKHVEKYKRMELGNNKNKSYSKGKDNINLENVHPKKNWTQQRTHTTNILLKINELQSTNKSKHISN